MDLFFVNIFGILFINQWPSVITMYDKQNTLIQYVHTIKNVAAKAPRLSDNTGLNDIIKKWIEIDFDISSLANIDTVEDESYRTFIPKSEYVSRIESRYVTFQSLLSNSTADNIMYLLRLTLFENFIQKNKEDFLVIREYMANNRHRINTVILEKYTHNMCDYEFAILKSYYNIYHRLSVLELKKYLMQAYVYSLFRYYISVFSGNLTYDIYTDKHYYKMLPGERVYLENDFYQKIDDQLKHSLPDNYNWRRIINYLKDYQHQLSEFAKKFESNGYKCTSGPPIRGEETLELTGIFQKIIAVEPEFRTNGECASETCSMPPSQRILSEFSMDGYNHIRHCDGHVEECKGLEDITICYSNFLFKRYEGFKFDNHIYGNMNSCPKGKGTISSWHRYLFIKCDVCLCTCITEKHDPTQVQMLSYTEQVSDIEDNMVVTNVRFVEKQKTIYIQIQQEKLISRGSDVPKNEEPTWKPIKVNNENAKQVRYLQRKLHLDDVIVPMGHVVTGVKFGYYEPEGGLMEGSYHKFQIQVRATPYNIIKNKLITSRNGITTSFWVTPQTMSSSNHPAYNRDRTHLNPYRLEEIDDPPVLADPIIDSEANQQIYFRSSSLEEDAGQSTIPYFDSRPPFSKKPFPLSGIGLSVRGYDRPSGYLTLKTFPYTIPPMYYTV